MLSSTSNFRSALRLGVSAVWVFAAVFACYSALIAIHPIYTQAFVSQWERNTIVGERLIYAAHSPPRIIVGSSIFLTMPQNELGPDIYNLSFAGVGSLTGLAVIKRLGLHPREVIIESNVIDSVNTELMHHFFSYPFYTLRRYFPVFFCEYRPVNVVLNWNQFEALTPPLDASITPERIDPATRDQIKKANLKVFATPLSVSEVEKLQTELHYYVDELMAMGVKVTLLAMPMDESIMNAGAFRSTRDAMTQAFPVERYEWIDVSNMGPFETRDGVHLVTQDAIRIARFLRQR